MGEKIFGEIANTEDLNELANNLRKTKEFDEIRLLCKENNIPEDISEAFIKGNRVTLATMGYLENRKALQSPTWQAVRAAAKEHLRGEEIAPAIERIRKGLLIPVKQKPEPVSSSYTVEDVKKKLEAELEIYRDGDSKYVVEKLIELCGTDKELLVAVMLPHKSYDKAFQYFYECSRTVGYKMPHGNMVYLDNDRAVKLSVDYFKRDDAASAKKAEKKKEPPKVKQKLPDKPTNTPEKKAEKIKQAVKPVEPKREIPVKELHPEPKPKKNEMSGQLSLFDF